MRTKAPLGANGDWGDDIRKPGDLDDSGGQRDGDRAGGQRRLQ